MSLMQSNVAMSLVLSATMSTAVFAQNGRGDSAFLNHEEIARIMEKLPAYVDLLSSPNTTQWQCTDVDVREHCGDLDGCTVNLHMTHKLDPNDQVRGIKEHLYFENNVTSAQRGTGRHGYTRQSGGGEHGWITGSTGQYTIFGPWGWSGAYNYRPAFCPGQSGNSPAHRNPFLITLASHPHVNTVVIIED